MFFLVLCACMVKPIAIRTTLYAQLVSGHVRIEIATIWLKWKSDNNELLISAAFLPLIAGALFSLFCVQLSQHFTICVDF